MAKPGKMQAFKKFIWNPNNRHFLGRTKDSWAKLIAFYIALYTCLALIWILFFQVFQQTISNQYPKWQLDESLIGTNPGVGFRPLNPVSKVDSALITFKFGKNGNFEHWVNDLNKYITSESKKLTQSSVKHDCHSERDSDSFCPFTSNLAQSSPCTVAQNFSYHLGTPCVLIKLNRIYGWKPQPYLERPSNYPKDAPFIKNQIQITCEGQNDPDKEHLGKVNYYPSSIDTKHYPFLNQPGYTSPYVMVHFTNPKHNALIYVECKAWAKNIEHDRFNKRGLTSFELFIQRPD